MAEFIVANTANEIWKKAEDLLVKKRDVLPSRSGDVYELLHTFISIKNPRQKWVYDRIPPISIGFALAELIWILNGEERSDVINYWNPKLPNFAGEGSRYHGAYGKRLRYHLGFDQLEQAYQVLQSNPESRQVVLQLYDSKIDFPYSNGQPRDTDIPCNVCSLLKVRDGKLEWSQIMRSNDLLLGMPYNFIQFTSLQEVLAGWLGIEVGSYNHYSDSLHLYCADLDKVGVGNYVDTINPDNLSIPKGEFEKLICEIYDRMIMLTEKNITEQEIFRISQMNSQYDSYNNIMFIIAAYVARKKHYYSLCEAIVECCSNSAYNDMWEAWVRYNDKQRIADIKNE